MHQGKSMLTSTPIAPGVDVGEGEPRVCEGEEEDVEDGEEEEVTEGEGVALPAVGVRVKGREREVVREPNLPPGGVPLEVELPDTVGVRMGVRVRVRRNDFVEVGVCEEDPAEAVGVEA